MNLLFQLQYGGQGLHLAVAPKWKEDVNDDRRSRTISGGGVVFLFCTRICLFICRPRCTDHAVLKVLMIANNWRGGEGNKSVAAMCNVIPGSPLNKLRKITKKTRSGYLVRQSKFEPGIARIQFRNVTTSGNFLGFPLRRRGFDPGWFELLSPTPHVRQWSTPTFPANE